jgi:hypothetical protein
MSQTFWRDRLGRLRRISSMKTKHLENVIEMLSFSDDYDDHDERIIAMKEL